jgi:hypothetical protein
MVYLTGGYDVIQKRPDKNSKKLLVNGLPSNLLQNIIKYGECEMLG